MGAEEVPWNGGKWAAFDRDELTHKLRTSGVDVDFGQINVADDGTFEYEGRKVLVYIRDQYIGGNGRRGEYKFHIANCSTISRAYENNRQSRYVVSTRTDGLFRVNLLQGSVVAQQDELLEMKVCKNCLMELKYMGYYNHSASRSWRIYSDFSLDNFFDQYGGTRHIHTPRFNDLNAPINQYSTEFNEISRVIREQRGFQCEVCGLDLVEAPRFLHLHHINADRSDNRGENLRCLCIKCHAREPEHARLRNSPDFMDFMDWVSAMELRTDNPC